MYWTSGTVSHTTSCTAFSCIGDAMHLL